MPWIVHAVPGRVRLRVPRERADEALALAHRLAAQRMVHAVRWVPSALSLTLSFHPDHSLAELLRPSASRAQPTPRGDRAGLLVWVRDGRGPRSPTWATVSLAAALTGLGPAVELLTHLAPPAYELVPLSALEA